MTYNPGASFSGQGAAFAPSAPAVDRNNLPVVSVFSPRAIFCVTLLLNVLGGFILSAISWSRLESPSKARGHIALGAVLCIGIAVLIAAVPALSGVVLLINLGVAFYLRSATQTDINEDDGISKRVEIINGWAAFGIGLLAVIPMAILIVILRPVMS